MKIFLPGFLALCLGVVPVFSQGVRAPEAATAGTESVEAAYDNGYDNGAEYYETYAPQSPAGSNVNATTEDTAMFSSDVPSMFRAFGGMGLVLCLLLGVYFGIRKFAPGYFPKMASGGKNLKIVESLGMGDRRSIALVEVGEKRFLIGSTPQQINLLTVLPEHFSLVAEDNDVKEIKGVKVKGEDEKQTFRNLFEAGKKRPIKHSREILPEEIRQKMRQLREALENR